ncbi:hypothetical protein [Gandjariella thermophila]|uniref:hypothetical protein n=1 Tax=Gandjariella thermophila TaxID=1931992 RepID=UPI0010F4F5F6|nr:hypothetical protein [Gandjariella thermophila]
MVRKHLGRLTQAVLASIVLSAAVTPLALAESETSSTSPSATASSTPSAPPSSTSSSPSTTRTTTPPTSTSKPGGAFEDGIILVGNGSQIFVIVGCAEAKPTNVHSDALRIDPLEQDPEDPRIWGALATVDPHATVGEHTVSADCAGKTLSFRFTILPGPTPGSAPVVNTGKGATGSKAGQVKVQPKGGVQTGSGDLAAIVSAQG